MKETGFIITDYCIIRSNRLVLNGELRYEGTENTPADLFTAIYRKFDINYVKFFKMDNLCKLGFLALEIMLRDKIPGQGNQSADTGLILSNAGSSVDSDRIHLQSIADRESYFPSPSVFVYTLANIIIGEICIRHKLYGESTFFIDRNFNAEGIYSYVKQLLDEGTIANCLTGWVEMNGGHYEAVVYFVQKSTGDNNGIAIFEPGNLQEIYLQGET